jgi:rubrerythrin
MGQNFYTLDDEGLSREELIRNGDFFLTLKKLAAGDPNAVGDPAGAMAPEAPPEAPGAELEAPPAMAAPEAPMAPPPAPDPLPQMLVGAISHDLRLQLAYLFYAETMRGLGRGELAELFRRHAEQEIQDAAYLMMRLAALVPGGMLIPPPPSPEPLSDPQQVVALLHDLELQAQTYLKAIHSMLADDPMRFTIEQMMTEEQLHADRLEQFMDAAPAAPAPALPETTQDSPEQFDAPPPGPVVEPAAEIDPAAAAAELPPPAPPTEDKPKRPGEKKTETETEKVADEVSERNELMDAAAMPVDQYLLKSQTSLVGQQQGEVEHLKRELATAQQQAAQASMQADSAQVTNQQLQESLSQQQQAAAAAQAEADSAVEQAAMAEESAANQAVAKMNATIRIQQMRTQLAELGSNIATMATADPAAEEGLGFGTTAGPGTPQTAQQQAMEAQMAAQMPGAVPPGGGEAAEQTQEATNAQAEADQQAAQAQQAGGAAPAPGGAPAPAAGGEGGGEAKRSPLAVTVKTSGLPDVLRNASAAAGHDGGYGAVHGAARGIGEMITAAKDKIHPAAAIGAGLLGTGAVVDHAVHRRREGRIANSLERLANNADYQRLRSY